jgi:predicted nucleotidyltransferase
VPSRSLALSPNEAARLREISRKHGVRRLRVFGSFARGDAGPGSDLDLLIALEPGRGFRDLLDFCDEVEASLHRKVDALMEDGLSPYIRDRVLEEAIAL